MGSILGAILGAILDTILGDILGVILGAILDTILGAIHSQVAKVGMSHTSGMSQTYKYLISILNFIYWSITEVKLN